MDISKAFACFLLVLLIVTIAGCGGDGVEDNDEPLPAYDAPINTLGVYASEVTAGTIRLKWWQPSENWSYRVYKDDVLETELHRYSTGELTVLFDHLMPNTEYCLRVSGHSHSFYYDQGSGEICVTTLPDTTQPEPPEGFRVDSIPAQNISLTWTEASDDGWVAGYRVYRDGVNLQSVTGLAFNDSGLSADTLYCYEITAIDAAGNESSRSIKSCASTSMLSEIVDLGYNPGSVGYVGITSLALDTDYNPYISYFDYTNKNLYLAGKGVHDLSISLVDSGVHGFASLAIDTSNKAHISYASDGVYKLKYASNVTGSWASTIVDENWVGLYSSLVIDQNGKAHISYYDYQNGNLKYATNMSDSWVVSTIDTGYLGQSTSLALDSAGKVYISYYDVGNGDLKIVTNATGAWLINTLDSAGDVGQFTSLAIDSKDKVHISYYDATNRHLKYATNTSGSWVTGIVDMGGSSGTGWNTSLAIDNNDHIHISYSDWGHDKLNYANNVRGTWMKYSISPGVSGLSLIKLDSSGRAHISSHQSNKIIYSIYSVY
jgi:hypothetical protein